MIEGLRAAAQLARDWAAQGRSRTKGRASKGRGDEVSTAFARLCTLIQARAYEVLAKALDAMAESEKTPVGSIMICPNCGAPRPAEWVPPEG